MTTAVDTVVPVARGQVRRSGSKAFLVLAPTVEGRLLPSYGYWKLLVLTGSLRSDVIEMIGTWVERWTEVVEP